LDPGPVYKLAYVSSPLLLHRLISSLGMSLIGSQPVGLHWRYILMRNQLPRHELVKGLCSWYRHVSSRRSLAVLFQRSKLEKTSREWITGTANTKHSTPVGLGISGLDPSSLTLTCLPGPSLVSTTLRRVGVGSISAARKRISLCEARCLRSRNINIKISANAATTPPTIGPS
jgi:hypothetical protein